MKYTLDGFSQEIAISFGLDSKDLRLIRYFIDFKDSGSMAKEFINNDVYYWVKYDGIIKNIPILKLSKKTIMYRFQELAKKGILKQYTKKEKGTFSYFAVGENYKYLISSSEGYPKKETGVSEKEDKGIPKSGQGYPKKETEGIPFFGQQNINLLKDSSIKDIDIYSRVIDYLNLKAKTKYKATTKKTQNLILARLKEEFTEDDFKLVIDKKVKEWLGTEFEKFLRPETLFGNKFEAYLNQRGGNNVFTRTDKQTNAKCEDEEFDFSKFSG